MTVPSGRVRMLRAPDWWRALFGDNDNRARTAPMGGEFLPVAQAIQRRAARREEEEAVDRFDQIRKQNGLKTKDEVRAEQKAAASADDKPAEKSADKKGKSTNDK